MKQKPSIDRVLHALGDPTRRAIVERVSDTPVSLSKLVEPLGITLAAVVQQVQILEESGVVRTEKVGRVRTCRLDPASLDTLDDWVRSRRSSWEVRLDRLGRVLMEDEENPG